VLNFVQDRGSTDAVEKPLRIGAESRHHVGILEEKVLSPREQVPEERRSQVLPARRGPVSTTAGKLLMARATCFSSKRGRYRMIENSKVSL
jgi:hypothetical protein